MRQRSEVSVEAVRVIAAQFTGWTRFTSHFFFFQAEDGIRDYKVTGVQTCALPIFRVAGQSVDTTPPSTPTGLSASAVSPSNINLSWLASTDNVGVTGYRIFRGGIQNRKRVV